MLLNTFSARSIIQCVEYYSVPVLILSSDGLLSLRTFSLWMSERRQIVSVASQSLKEFKYTAVVHHSLVLFFHFFFICSKFTADSKNKNIRGINRVINEFKKGY